MAQDQSWCWGVNDCCTFARGAVLSVGGPDLGGDWAGSYQDEPGAQEAVLALGEDFETAVASVCTSAGLSEVARTFAKRGDLLIIFDPVMTARLPIAAICNGAFGMAMTRSGLLRMPMQMTVRAWAV